MSDALPTTSEQPRILPAEVPAWLKPQTIIFTLLLLGGFLGIILWQAAKSEKARTESNRLLFSSPGQETWSKLIRDYPNQPATALALLESAADASEKKDPRKAAGLYQQMLRQFPQHPLAPAARLAQANQLAIAGDRAQAQSLYLGIMNQRPPDAFRSAAAFGLARLQIQENRPEAARQVLNDILAENTGSAFLPDLRSLLAKLPPPPAPSTPASPFVNPTPAAQPPAK